MRQTYKETTNNGKTDKVERYGWKLLDSPGELRWLKKNILRIDPAYQRNANERKVFSLSRAWSWLACGALLVAERDGEYFVFDGQHRALAALRRSDIDALPCVVFPTSGHKEEATAFLGANKNRKPLESFAVFNASLTAQLPHAQIVNRLVTASGRIASSKAGPGKVRCLSVMMRYAVQQPTVLERVWPLVVEICEGRTLHDKILEGFIYIESRLPAPQSMMDSKWKKRAIRVGYDGLLGAAHRFAAAYSSGGAKVWATGMLEIMNKGFRDHIVLVGGETK